MVCDSSTHSHVTVSDRSDQLTVTLPASCYALVASHSCAMPAGRRTPATVAPLDVVVTTAAAAGNGVLTTAAAGGGGGGDAQGGCDGFDGDSSSSGRRGMGFSAGDGPGEASAAAAADVLAAAAASDLAGVDCSAAGEGLFVPGDLGLGAASRQSSSSSMASELEESVLGGDEAGCVLNGAVKVQILKGGSKGSSVAYTWFHTSFLPSCGHYSLSKAQLDKAAPALPSGVQLSLQYEELWPAWGMAGTDLWRAETDGGEGSPFSGARGGSGVGWLGAAGASSAGGGGGHGAGGSLGDGRAGGVAGTSIAGQSLAAGVATAAGGRFGVDVEGGRRVLGWELMREGPPGSWADVAQHCDRCIAKQQEWRWQGGVGKVQSNGESYQLIASSGGSGSPGAAGVREVVGAGGGGAQQRGKRLGGTQGMPRNAAVSVSAAVQHFEGLSQKQRQARLPTLDEEEQQRQQGQQQVQGEDGGQQLFLAGGLKGAASLPGLHQQASAAAKAMGPWQKEQGQQRVLKGAAAGGSRRSSDGAASPVRTAGTVVGVAGGYGGSKSGSSTPVLLSKLGNKQQLSHSTSTECFARRLSIELLPVRHHYSAPTSPVNGFGRGPESDSPVGGSSKGRDPRDAVSSSGSGRDAVNGAAEKLRMQEAAKGAAAAGAATVGEGRCSRDGTPVNGASKVATDYAAAVGGGGGDGGSSDLCGGYAAKRTMAAPSRRNSIGSPVGARMSWLGKVSSAQPVWRAPVGWMGSGSTSGTAPSSPSTPAHAAGAGGAVPAGFSRGGSPQQALDGSGAAAGSAAAAGGGGVAAAAAAGGGGGGGSMSAPNSPAGAVRALASAGGSGELYGAWFSRPSRPRRTVSGPPGGVGATEGDGSWQQEQLASEPSLDQLLDALEGNWGGIGGAAGGAVPAGSGSSSGVGGGGGGGNRGIPPRGGVGAPSRGRRVSSPASSPGMLAAAGAGSVDARASAGGAGVGAACITPVIAAAAVIGDVSQPADQCRDSQEQQGEMQGEGQQEGEGHQQEQQEGALKQQQDFSVGAGRQVDVRPGSCHVGSAASAQAGCCSSAAVAAPNRSSLSSAPCRGPQTSASVLAVPVPAAAERPAVAVGAESADKAEGLRALPTAISACSAASLQSRCNEGMDPELVRLLSPKSNGLGGLHHPHDQQQQQQQWQQDGKGELKGLGQQCTQQAQHQRRQSAEAVYCNACGEDEQDEGEGSYQALLGMSPYRSAAVEDEVTTARWHLLENSWQQGWWV